MSNLTINHDKFFEQIQVVLDMNALFRNTIDNPDLILPQANFVLEEYNETIERGILNKDKKEFVDGLADIFVTASFLSYLLSGNMEKFKETYNKQFNMYEHMLKNNEELKTNKQFVTYLQDIIGLTVLVLNNKLDKVNNDLIFKMLMVFDYVNRNTHQEYIQLVIPHIQNKTQLMTDVIDEVNKSNMSKFPLTEDKTLADLDKDLKHIANKLGHDNVDYIVKNGRITYMDKERNKFQKPLTFVEPNLDFANSLNSLDDMVFKNQEVPDFVKPVHV
jgi:hypothetical protein